MAKTFSFKDSKLVDNLARALVFVSKFSKQHALIKIKNQSIDIVWCSMASYHVTAQIQSCDMAESTRQSSNNDFNGIVIEANPETIGRTLKSGNIQDKIVKIQILLENKIKIFVLYNDGLEREVTHSIPCEHRTPAEFEERMDIYTNLNLFDIKCYIEKFNSLRHFIESFVKLDVHRIYIWSKQGGDLTITARSQGSNHILSWSDLECENRFEDGHGNDDTNNEAGVNVDTKKLAVFLSNLINIKDYYSRFSFEIKKNQWLKVTYESSTPNREKFLQTLILTHSLTSN